jgi:hypothetical protein
MSTPVNNCCIKTCGELFSVSNFNFVGGISPPPKLSVRIDDAVYLYLKPGLILWIDSGLWV